MNARRVAGSRAVLLGRRPAWRRGRWLLAGCAPQLDRIEVAVQENRDEISRLQAENKRLLQEVEALGQLLRWTGRRRRILGHAAGQAVPGVHPAGPADAEAGRQRRVHARPVGPGRSAGHAAGDSHPGRVQAAGGHQRRRPRPCPRRAGPSSRWPSWTATGATSSWPGQGFEEFLSKYGESEVADDALYWLGDLAYGEGDRCGRLALF